MKNTQLPTGISDITLYTNKTNYLFGYVTSMHTAFKKFISKCNLKKIISPSGQLSTFFPFAGL